MLVLVTRDGKLNIFGFGAFGKKKAQDAKTLILSKKEIGASRSRLLL